MLRGIKAQAMLVGIAVIQTGLIGTAKEPTSILTSEAPTD
jgi:hypothetical protein